MEQQTFIDICLLPLPYNFPNAITILAITLIGYILGSIPFGLVLCKIFGLGDIRSIGSGNIGATNVLRTGNKLLALTTLLLDSGKGALAILTVHVLFFTTLIFSQTNTCGAITSASHPTCNSPIIDDGRIELTTLLITGFFALIGHCYPIWLKFKGGKGVATTLGTLLAATPYVGLAACAIWFVTALIFRISSLAALVAVGLTPVISHYIYNDPNLSGVCALIAALVYIKHRENIKRLFSGEEPKIGDKKKK